MGTVRFRPDAVPYAVGLFITAGYWFTSSTSFANPSVTIARSLTDTFSGIMPVHAPGFVLAVAWAPQITTTVEMNPVTSCARNAVEEVFREIGGQRKR